MKRIPILFGAALAALALVGCQAAVDTPQFVRVTIDYVVEDPSGEDPHGQKHLSPGVWVVIADDATNPLFSADPKARAALGMLAEVGKNNDLAEIAAEADVLSSGTFGGTPHDTSGSRSFNILVPASGGTLYFATMVAGSNDWFLAPAAGGIDVLNADGEVNTTPVDLVVWDAGTEKDLNAAGDDLNIAEFGGGADMDNTNDADDENMMVRHADTMMKAVTATATLSAVE